MKEHTEPSDYVAKTMAMSLAIRTVMPSCASMRGARVLCSGRDDMCQLCSSRVSFLEVMHESC